MHLELEGWIHKESLTRTIDIMSPPQDELYDYGIDWEGPIPSESAEIDMVEVSEKANPHEFSC